LRGRPGGRAVPSTITSGAGSGGRPEWGTDEGVVVSEASSEQRSAAWPGGAPEVGQRASMSRLVERRYIDLFSEISGDYNPVHYDEAVAAASPFGGIIVQGGITSSILNAVVAQELPGPGTVFLQLDLAFLAAVRPGDTIVGDVEVLEVRHDKPITKLAVSVTRDDGVIALRGNAVCFTAPPAVTASAGDAGRS
jgi:acyl dehydratase